MISVIVPSRHRSEQLRVYLGQLSNVSPGIEIITVLDYDDVDSLSLRLPGQRVVMEWKQEPPTPVEKWNTGLAAATGDAFVLGGDDHWFKQGWLEDAQACLEEGAGFIGLAEQREIGWPVIYLMTREWCKKWHGGVLCVPHYKSQCVDKETYFRAMRSQDWIWPEGVVENHHPYHGTKPWDDIYRRGQAWSEEDHKTFERRRSAGFPDDFPPVLR